MGLAEDINKLEKRLMQMEMFLGITPLSNQLTHPHAFKQAVRSRESSAAHDLLRDALHRYIYAHYDQGTQASLTAMVVGILALCFNPAASEGERAQAQSQLILLIAAIMPAWQWVQQVLAHFYDVDEMITANGGSYIDPDFSQFDDSDPGASLRALVRG